MAAKLIKAQVLTTAYEFECSSGKKVTFLLEAEYVNGVIALAHLIPKEEHTKISIADLITICEVVQKEYAGWFNLEYNGSNVLIKSDKDVNKQLIENLII